MKASPRQQRLLLHLQELDTTAARLRHRMKNLPERAQLQAIEAEHAAATAAFMEVQRELDTHQAEIERIEADIVVVRERTSRDEELLARSSSSKEAQALQNEIETLARRTSALEDRQLELMELVEEAQVRFDAAQSTVADVEERAARLRAAIASALEQTESERLTAAEERAGLAAEIQRDVLDLYEQTRRQYGVGAARLRGNVSEGSNMALAPAELAEINRSAPDEIVFCPDSGVILVRDSE